MKDFHNWMNENLDQKVQGRFGSVLQPGTVKTKMNQFGASMQNSDMNYRQQMNVILQTLMKIKNEGTPDNQLIQMLRVAISQIRSGALGSPEQQNPPNVA